MENFENLIPQAPLSLLLDPPPSSILCQQRTAAATLIVFIKHFLLWTNEELGTILLQNLTAHTSSRTFWVWSFEEREHDGRVKGTVIKFIRNSLFFFLHTLLSFSRTNGHTMMMVEIHMLMLMAFPKEHTCAAPYSTQLLVYMYTFIDEENFKLEFCLLHI